LAIEPLDLVFLGEAGAAVDAECVLHDFLAVLGGEVLGHPGFEVVAGAAVLRPGRHHHHLMCGLYLRPHLGQPEHDGLMLGYRLAEGAALLGVINCELERPSRDSATTRRDIDPPNLNAIHHLVKALSRFAAKHGTNRQPELVKNELCRVDSLVAHLVDLAGNGETWRDLPEADLLFDQ